MNRKLETMSTPIKYALPVKNLDALTYFKLDLEDYPDLRDAYEDALESNTIHMPIPELQIDTTKTIPVDIQIQMLIDDMNDHCDYNNIANCVKLMELVRISDIPDSKKLVDWYMNIDFSKHDQASSKTQMFFAIIAERQKLAKMFPNGHKPVANTRAINK